MKGKLKKHEKKSLTDSIILYSGIGVAILAAVVFALLMYSKNLSDDVKNSTMSLEKMANLAENVTADNTTNMNVSDTQSTSTQLGKTVEESQNETTNQVKQNTTKVENTTKQNTQATNTTNKAANQNTKTQNTASSTVATNAEEKKETKQELSFEKPVEGEIVREYAKDNLIYSQTLKEWTTHMGIDIKAEKTTVVKAAESGTVKTIKNDPRYGLTITIEHEDGFQTVYSNLLTSEFVVEGEKVRKRSINRYGGKYCCI